MSNENMEENKLPGLEGRDCVPFFKEDKTQIIFEFCYLVALLVFACVAVFILQLGSDELGINHSDKLALYALLGGFLGGWVYDAKWFYRVTARGKDDQYNKLDTHSFHTLDSQDYAFKSHHLRRVAQMNKGAKLKPV